MAVCGGCRAWPPPSPSRAPAAAESAGQALRGTRVWRTPDAPGLNGAGHVPLDVDPDIVLDLRSASPLNAKACSGRCMHARASNSNASLGMHAKANLACMVVGIGSAMAGIDQSARSGARCLPLWLGCISELQKDERGSGAAGGREGEWNRDRLVDVRVPIQCSVLATDQ